MTRAAVGGWIGGVKSILFALRVADLDRSLEFYKAVGYEDLGVVPFADGSRLVWLKLADEPSVSLELVHRPDGGDVEPGGFEHFAIDVGDLAATLERLRAAGLEPGEPEAHEGPDGSAAGPKTAWLVDPDGYRIELVEWPPGFLEGLGKG